MLDYTGKVFAEQKVKGQKNNPGQGSSSTLSPFIIHIHSSYHS